MANVMITPTPSYEWLPHGKKVALFISAGSSAYHVYVEMYVLTEDPTTCTKILNLSSNMPPPPLTSLMELQHRTEGVQQAAIPCR